MKINDGGPAFPVGLGTQQDQYICSEGMTLRDWFAGQALAGIMAASAEAKAVSNPKTIISAMSYAIADAMLKARETPND